MNIKDNRICTRVQLNSIIHSEQRTYCPDKIREEDKELRAINYYDNSIQTSRNWSEKSVRRYLRKLLIWNYKHLQVGTRKVGQVNITTLCFPKY